MNNTMKRIFSYEQTLEYTREAIKPYMNEDIAIEKSNRENNVIVEKDKRYLREKSERYLNYIKQILNKADFQTKKDNVSCFSIEDLSRILVAEFVGFSVLSPLYENEEVTDIFCIRWDLIFYERNHKLYKFKGKFLSAKHFNDFMTGKLREAGKEINNADKKIVDFDLYEDRYAATSKVVTPVSPSLTIRKHALSHVTTDDMLTQEVCSEDMLECMGCMVAGEANVVIAGVTGCGKTTSLRAVLNKFLKLFNKRVIVAEDTRELFLDYEHVLEMVSSKDGKNPISLRDIVLTSLRLKPDMNIIGEVRGAEMEAAVESAATGHSTWFSMHSDKEEDVIDRAELKYLDSKPSIGTEIAERIICMSIDFIIIQQDIPDIGRKITKISQLLYDKKQKTYVINPIFKYNIRTNSFDKVGVFDDGIVEKMEYRIGKNAQSLLEKFAREGYFDDSIAS